MATNFITNTPSLKTTIADVRKLNAKKIYLGGENILDLIKSSNNTSSSITNIKHDNNTRETVTENDIWGPWIETKSDGTIVVHDDEVINPNLDDNNAWNTSITKVVGNKAYKGDEFYANIQTENIEDGSCMFRGCSNFSSVDGGDMNLHNLTNGYCMFDGCTNMTSFYCELPSLTNGHCMFSGCTNLKAFNYGTYNLKDGRSMFHNCVNLKKLDIRNWQINKNTTSANYANIFTNVPSNCLIIVKDESCRTWVKARRSAFTNIKLVSELEG
jgi:hypothetical protein